MFAGEKVNLDLRPVKMVSRRSSSSFKFSDSGSEVLVRFTGSSLTSWIAGLNSRGSFYTRTMKLVGLTLCLRRTRRVQKSFAGESFACLCPVALFSV